MTGEVNLTDQLAVALAKYHALNRIHNDLESELYSHSGAALAAYFGTTLTEDNSGETYWKAVELANLDELKILAGVDHVGKQHARHTEEGG
jgi:hypothetical protein